MPRLITHDQAVRIAIQRQTDIGPMGADGLAHGGRIGGTTEGIDILAIGGNRDGHNRSAQFTQHDGGHLIGGTMGAIDHDLQ